MSPSPTRMDAATAAYVALTEHRFYRYRGCAPDPDNPRLAVGSPGVDEQGRPVRVAVDAWHGPDVDGGEAQKVRQARVEAAKEVCLRCPVMVWCDQYAMLAPQQADGVRGGRTKRERDDLTGAKKPARKTPSPAPVEHLRTKQKLAVLEALAASADEYRVAMETGLGVQKTNWQRAILVSGLGLERNASRMDLLRAAVAAELLEASAVVADDGQVPAIPPATKKLLIELRQQLLLGPVAPEEAWDWSQARPWRPSAGPRSVSLRAKFAHVDGQMAFDTADTADAAAPDEDWTYVHELFPEAPVLEAAA